MHNMELMDDGVQHANLLRRYYARYGLRGNVLNWMKSYLTERSSCVCINNCMSNWIQTDCGFPQGSVLGRKKFIMFAAPVADIADSHCVKHSRYADDNNEFVTFSTANPFEMEAALDNLNNCLVDLMQWTRQNMLKLNDDKTKVIVFAPKKDMGFVRNYELSFGNFQIQPSSEVKNLGVFLDNQLTMQKHANFITKKVYCQLRRISKIRSVLSLCNMFI